LDGTGSHEEGGGDTRRAGEARSSAPTRQAADARFRVTSATEKEARLAEKEARVTEKEARVTEEAMSKAVEVDGSKRRMG